MRPIALRSRVLIVATGGAGGDLQPLVAAALALKYKSGDPADPSQESSEGAEDGGARTETGAAPEPQLAAAAGDGLGADAKLGSRWRLALRDRPAVSEAE